jgi:translation initiation factor 2 alpha subunit (eIF-2alpha)
MKKTIDSYSEGEIILCTVEEIGKTTVFVTTEDGIKGSIVLSEIAPGRIRNLREYVVPKKIIVCKILKIHDNHLFLSLRRVKNNERQEMLEQNKKEKTIGSIIKKNVGEKSNEIIEKIKEKYEILEFFEKSKENPKLLDEYFNEKEKAEMQKIILEKKEKEREIKKEFKITSMQPDGIKRIKKILSGYKGITYLGGSKFQIKIKSLNLKQAGNEINKIIEEIEKNAKKEKCEFELKK